MNPGLPESLCDLPRATQPLGDHEHRSYFFPRSLTILPEHFARLPKGSDWMGKSSYLKPVDLGVMVSLPVIPFP